MLAGRIRAENPSGESRCIARGREGAREGGESSVRWNISKMCEISFESHFPPLSLGLMNQAGLYKYLIKSIKGLEFSAVFFFGAGRGGEGMEGGPVDTRINPPPSLFLSFFSAAFSFWWRTN